MRNACIEMQGLHINGADYCAYSDRHTFVNDKRSGTIDTTSFKAEILRYIDGAERVVATNRKNPGFNDNASAYNAYILEDNGGGEKRTRWYLGYVLPPGAEGARMKSKLASRAKSQGLVQDNKKANKQYTNGDIVWMEVLRFE